MTNYRQYSKDVKELKLTQAEKDAMSDILEAQYRNYLKETVLEDESFDITMTEDFFTWVEEEIRILRESFKEENTGGTFEEWIRDSYLNSRVYLIQLEGIRSL